MSDVKVMKDLIQCEETGDAGKMDLYLPDKKKCIALLFYFHGGGWKEGTE